MNLLTAKAMGAAEVVVTDINEGRLEVAKTLGADHVYKVRTFKNLVVCLNELELWPCAKVDVTKFRFIHNGGESCPDGIDRFDWTEVYDFGNWLFTIVDFSSGQDPGCEPCLHVRGLHF